MVVVVAAAPVVVMARLVVVVVVVVLAKVVGGSRVRWVVVVVAGLISMLLGVVTTSRCGETVLRSTSEASLPGVAKVLDEEEMDVSSPELVAVGSTFIRAGAVVIGANCWWSGFELKCAHGWCVGSFAGPFSWWLVEIEKSNACGPPVAKGCAGSWAAAANRFLG